MEDLGTLVRQLAGTHGKDMVNFYVGSVTEVNEDDRTCDVSITNSDSHITIPGVQLSVSSGDGIVNIPKVGSDVIIGMTQKGMALVLMLSDLDYAKIYADEEVHLQGDEFGGLVKADALKEQLDKTNEVLNAVVTAITTWTPASGDGGAALKVFAASQLTGKATGVFTDIKNDKVKHGNS